MRNKVLGLVTVMMLMAVSVCGCQKAPEGSEQGGILHAKDSVEDEVATIVNEPESAMENTTQEINSTIGTGGNVIRIQAQMPNIPQNVYHIMLGENETLTKDVLTEFLGSETGNIKDLSEEAQKEMEQFRIEMNRVKNEPYFLSLEAHRFIDCRMETGRRNLTVGRARLIGRKLLIKSVRLPINLQRKRC